MTNPQHPADEAYGAWCDVWTEHYVRDAYRAGWDAARRVPEAPLRPEFPALLPCPFCGNVDRAEFEVAFRHQRLCVGCSACGAAGPAVGGYSPLPRDMAAAWNRRVK